MAVKYKGLTVTIEAYQPSCVSAHRGWLVGRVVTCVVCWASYVLCSN